MTWLRITDALKAPVGTHVTVKGWVRTRRDSKADGGLSFIALHDGTCFDAIQVVARATLANYANEVAKLGTGCAVEVRGHLVASQGKGQSVEVVADDIKVHGWVDDPDTYPVSQKRHTFEYLREVAHLRVRTNTFGAVARVRHCLAMAVHRFFDEHGFYYVHTPIITGSDCEGAGQMFRVSTLDLMNLPMKEGTRHQASGTGGGPEKKHGDKLEPMPSAKVDDARERAVIGAMLIDPKLTADFVRMVQSPDAFSNPVHASAFRALAETQRRNRPGDLVLLAELLRDDEAIQQAGGPNYLKELAQSAVDADVAQAHAREIGRAYQQQQASGKHSTLDHASSTSAQCLVPSASPIDFSHDFFGKETNLTVSGQLNVETYASALSRVYTFGPTFRAENSNTSRHLAEFWMIEPEIAFADLAADADLAESFIKYLLDAVLTQRADDMAFFNERIEPGLLDRLKHVLEQPFRRVTYTDGVDILLKAKKSWEFPVEWGKDLQSEHERYLTEEHFKQPVILTNYPKQIKAFYMRADDGCKPGRETVSAMDVLVPKIGEIIGGSQREERLDVLDARIDEMGLHKADYWWYRDLRRYGTVPHAGFGLGFERLMLMVTGMQNIRDVIPFPRAPKQADF